MITELRRYRIKPGRLDSWLTFFAQAARQSERHGSRVEYAGMDSETNTFVWLRSFRDEKDRKKRKDAIYGSHWWLEREAFAMDHVLDYEVTFLDAVLVRKGPVGKAPWPASGEPAGSGGDEPPDGWLPSTRRSYARRRRTG